MKKQKIQLIGLLVALIIVVGGYLAARYLVVDEDLVTTQSISEEVFHIAKENVKEVTYTVGGVYIGLINEDGIWKLKDDKSLELDQDKISDIVGFATYLNSKSVIEDPAPLDDYGLTSPEYVIKVVTNDGAEKMYYIGDKYAMGDTYFAAVEGESVVYTIADTYPNAFTTDVSELVAKQDEETETNTD